MRDHYYPTSHTEWNLFLQYGALYGVLGTLAVAAPLFASGFGAPPHVWVPAGLMPAIGCVVVAVRTRLLKDRIINETSFDEA